jgi:aspartate/methionine/tyrosine aminotransferase
MPIEIESPEELGYGNIACNLTESSVRDLALRDLDVDLRDLVLAYTDHRGKPALRAGIAAEGEGLTADDVLITAGAAAALFIVATTLLKAGDHLVVAHPNYATNLETPLALGCEVERLPLRFEEGFRIDLDRLEAMIRPETRLVSLTCPHNPSGMRMTELELRRVVELVERAGCRLLLDETYRELVPGGMLPLAAALSPRVISVSSLSKAYGLPGIRVGWLISRDRALMETFLAAKEQIFVCNSVIDEELAHVAMCRKEALLEPIRAHTRRAFGELKDWMARQPFLEWVEPEGGVVCFPRIRAELEVDVERFYRVLNERFSTYVGPGHWFGMDRRYMRIGYAWPKPEELRQGLENLQRALELSRT